MRHAAQPLTAGDWHGFPVLFERALQRKPCGSGRGAARAHASPPISATKAPTCSVPSARRAAPARRSRPYADSEAMQLHLVEISSRVRRGAHAVLLLDRAGWHTTGRLVVPKNITLVFLPSRAPELNPVENIWQYLRQNWLSNRVFETYEAIIEAACDAWRSLLAEPTTITSIGHRGWAHVGQK